MEASLLVTVNGPTKPELPLEQALVATGGVLGRIESALQAGVARRRWAYVNTA